MKNDIRQHSHGFMVVFFAMLALVLAPVANAAAPTFTKVFIPDTIGPGSTSTLWFDVTNGDPTPVDNMAFADALPAGVTIATPANTTNTCGSGSILSAPDGGTTITFSGGKLGAASSCLITVDVTSNTLGTHNNNAGVLTSDQPDSAPLMLRPI